MVPEILGDLTQKFDDLWQTRPGQQTVCDIENGPVEIVDLPSYKMVVFHSYVEVYQRVVRTRCEGLACFNNQESWAEFDQGISPATLGNSSGKG